MLGLGILSLIVAAVAFTIMAKCNNEDTSHTVSMCIGIVAAICSIVLIGKSMARTIDTGHIGIVKLFGQVQPGYLTSGLNFVNPISTIVDLEIRDVQTVVETEIYTSDGQPVTVKMRFTSSCSPDDASGLYERYGEDFRGILLSPKAITALKQVGGQMTADKMITERSSYTEQVEKLFRKAMGEGTLTVNNFTIDDIVFDASYEQSIIEKQQAVQDAMKAEAEADRKIAEERGNAESRKLVADAEAYEITAKATATAEANEKIAASLTPELNKYYAIEKWNGNVPVAMGGSGTVPFLNINGMMDNSGE